MAVMPRPERIGSTSTRADAGARPRLWSAPSTDSSLGLLLDEFTRRWEHGDRPRAEDYFHLLPNLDQDSRVELVFHEFSLAESSGLEPDLEHFRQRFPDQGDRLEVLLQIREIFPAASQSESDHPSITDNLLPRAGDEVGPYLLTRELGRGGFSRVFLAEQIDLENRSVVVKVTDRPSAEPRLLARAPHPNIVPVLREATTEEGLQIICMPFHGGATLESTLEHCRRSGGRAASGSALLEALDAAGAPEFPTDLALGTTRDLLARSSYPRAIAWMMARLANALDHAYQRGITHGDLKPSNVLIAANAQPMLLDFNLSTDWKEPWAVGGIGTAGTLGYMAPERLRAIADPDSSLGTTVQAIDRHRADLYSMGLMLLESLTGLKPELPRIGRQTPEELAAKLARARGDGRGGTAAHGVRRGAAVGSRSGWPSSLPAGLRPVLARCLDPSPARRYRGARELAQDLDRWRADLPLAHARPAWWLEPLRWIRRRKRPLIALGITGAIAAGAAGLVLSHEENLERLALARLSATWDRLDPRFFPFHTMGEGSWGMEPLSIPAANAWAALDQYHIPSDPAWLARDEFAHLPETDRLDAAAWLSQQGWCFGLAVSRPEFDGLDVERSQALVVLDRVSQHATTKPIQSLKHLLRGSPASLESTTGDHWLEEFMAGVEAETTRQDDAIRLGLDANHLTHQNALIHFANSVADQPGFFWPNYRLAAAAFRVQNHALALKALGSCVRIRPRNAAARIAMARVLYELGRRDEARRLCDAVRQDDPTNPFGSWSSCFLAKNAGQREKELLRYKLASSGTPTGRAPLGALAQMSLGGLLSMTTLNPALTSSSPQDGDIDLRMCRVGWLLEEKQYEPAFDELSLILELAPDHLLARFDRAVCAHRIGQVDIAYEDYRRLVGNVRFDDFATVYPGALRVFTVVSAIRLREGDVQGAIELGERGLARALEAGYPSGEAHYALGSAYAVAARNDLALLDVAADHFRQAAMTNPRFLEDVFEQDRLLDPIRLELTWSVFHPQAE